MSEQIINAQELTLIRDNRRLFKDITFSLNSGEAIHVRGKNGSGKTSLLKIIMGTLTPTFGEITIAGKKTNNLDPHDYQNILSLGHKNPIKESLTIEENLLFNSTLFDTLPVNADAISFALTKVGLLNYRNQLASRLSAGQKRRISLARLWIASHYKETKNQLWILDEPLTALDTDFIIILQKHIESHLQRGGSVIFTSHQTLVLNVNVHELNIEDFQ